MKKLLIIFGIIILFVVLSIAVLLQNLLSQYENTKTREESTGHLSLPEIYFKSAIPRSWIITIRDNARPVLWEGSPDCKFIKLDNPSEKYTDQNGGFDYNAWHNFWFCPVKWVGKAPEISPEAQVYPAKFLCDCDDYKIFNLTLGENLQGDLPEKVKQDFSQNRRQTAEWAIEQVRNRDDVVKYEARLKKFGKKASFETTEDIDSWSVHVFEIVKNPGELSHTATFGWYSVNKKTGQIEVVI